MNSEILTLHCWVYGAAVSDTFRVEISNTETVENLKKAIKNKRPVDFRSIDAIDLELHQLFIPEKDDQVEDQLENFVLNRDCRLSGWRKLSQVLTTSTEGEWFIIVHAPNLPIILNYWIRGDDLHHVFSVEVLGTRNVAFLKDVIKPKIAYELPARDLALYQVSIPRQDLDTVLTYKPSDHMPLHPMDILFEKFPKVPPNHLHLIIVPPEKKRGRSPLSTDPARDPKRKKIVTTPPSEAAQPNNYQQIQEQPEEKVLDDRPLRDDIPPVSLIYDGFGQFFDIVAGHTDVDGLSDVDVGDLQWAVDEFAEAMCEIFNCEAERNDKGLQVIRKIFSARRGVPKLLRYYGGTNWNYLGDHKVAVVITEFKNSSAGNVAMPEAKLVARFAQTYDQAVGDLKTRMDGWRVPGLGITVIGPDIKFYAILGLDTQFRLVSLTPTLSCICSASEGADRDALYRAFAAASVFQHRVLRDGREGFPMVGSNNLRLPGVSGLRPWGNSAMSGDSFEFKIQVKFDDLFGEPRSNRLLYLAKTKLGEEIFVKFTRRYCPELHAICATSGHAPDLLAYERLSGGWYGVAMTYLPDAVPITTHDHISEHVERWKSDLRKVVKHFHDNGFVHGDLRDANIISGNDGRAMIVDFDWGGKDGEVSYPTPNLNEDLSTGRLSGDLVITKRDDERILENTLNRVEGLCS